MKIGLVSDSHGNRAMVERALRVMGPVDLLVHLGDGANLDMIGCQHPRTWKLRGNMDLDSSLAAELVEPLEGGVRALFCHGDRYRVKMGLDQLVYRARELEVGLVCFGHTHRSHISYEEGVLFVNPGSCRGYGATCAVIEITRSGELHPQIISLEEP